MFMQSLLIFVYVALDFFHHPYFGGDIANAVRGIAFGILQLYLGYQYRRYTKQDEELDKQLKSLQDKAEILEEKLAKLRARKSTKNNIAVGSP
jgi:hypothetical protein